MNLRPLALTCLLTVLAGCQSIDLGKMKDVATSPFAKKEPKVETSEFATPHKMVAVWSDAVYTEPGAPSVRGFGGRLYFYDQQNEPISVEGQLVVYGYDDSLPGQQEETPSRKFVFTPEQLTTHFTPSDLGASYSVWIPWDEAGGERKSISLLPVFRATSGRVVMAQQSVNVLPGKAPAEELVNRKGHFTDLPGQRTGGVVQPVSFEENAADALPGSGRVDPNSWQQDHMFQPSGVPERQLRTTTIQLPMSVSRRLQAEQAVAQQNLGPSAAAEAEGTGNSGTTLHRFPTADPAEATGGAASDATASPPLTPPAARFLRPTHRAPASPSARPGFGRARTPQLPAGLPRVPPFQPAADSSRSTG